MSSFRVRVARTIDASPESVLRAMRDYRGARRDSLPRPPFTTLEVVEGGFGAGTALDLGIVLRGSERRMRGTVSESKDEEFFGRLTETYDALDFVVAFAVVRTDRAPQATVESRGIVPERGLSGMVARWRIERTLKSGYRHMLDRFAEQAKAMS